MTDKSDWQQLYLDAAAAGAGQGLALDALHDENDALRAERDALRVERDVALRGLQAQLDVLALAPLAEVFQRSSELGWARGGEPAKKS